MKTSVAMIDTTAPQHLSVACEPLNVPAETGVLMPWGSRQLLLTEAAGISIGGSLGPLVTGYIFDISHSYHWAFILCAFLSLTGLVLTMSLKSTRN